MSLLFCHFFVHFCLVLCCLIAFPPIHLPISLLLVICFKLVITRTPNNSNFFLFPWKVRVIRSRLYCSKMTEKWHEPTPGVHLREVPDLKRCPLRERVDCNILISIFIIDLHRSHYKILKVINLIFTGCIVPPATTLQPWLSLTTLVKCTAGLTEGTLSWSN